MSFWVKADVCVVECPLLCCWPTGHWLKERSSSRRLVVDVGRYALASFQCSVLAGEDDEEKLGLYQKVACEGH